MVYMKPALKKYAAFAGKSALWSFLLYLVMMLAINWDDVSGAVKGNHAITIIDGTSDNNAAVTPNTSTRPRAIKSVIAIVRTLAGFSAQPLND